MPQRFEREHNFFSPLLNYFRSATAITGIAMTEKTNARVRCETEYRRSCPHSLQMSTSSSAAACQNRLPSFEGIIYHRAAAFFSVSTSRWARHFSQKNVSTVANTCQRISRVSLRRKTYL